MWLANVESILQSIPLNDRQGTDLSLALLERTLKLLGDGSHWRDESLAVTSAGVSCDPLSPEAAHFSLRGAAALARWEMREQIAAAEISSAHVQQLMNTLFAMLGEYRTNPVDWAFAKSVLEGTRNALEDYRLAQTPEDERPQPQIY
jgi:hypothetical protein